MITSEQLLGTLKDELPAILRLSSLKRITFSVPTIHTIGIFHFPSKIPNA